MTAFCLPAVPASYDSPRKDGRIVTKGQRQCFLSSKTQSNQYPAAKVLRRSSKVAIAQKIQLCCKPPCLLFWVLYWIVKNILQLVAFGKVVLLAFNTSSSIFTSNIWYLTCSAALAVQVRGFFWALDCAQSLSLNKLDIHALMTAGGSCTEWGWVPSMPYATITRAAPAPAAGGSLHPGRCLKPACCVQRHSFSWSFAIGLCCKVQFKFKPLFLGPVPLFGYQEIQGKQKGGGLAFFSICRRKDRQLPSSLLISKSNQKDQGAQLWLLTLNLFPAPIPGSVQVVVRAVCNTLEVPSWRMRRAAAVAEPSVVFISTVLSYAGDSISSLLHVPCLP